MLYNAVNGRVNASGLNMSYVSFGAGKKALVILPGLSDGLATVAGKALILAPAYKAFFKDYTVYIFSRRDGLPGTHTIRDMADDQAAAMAALGIERACVMGVSQGGMIAQALAAGCPQLVEKLVLAVSAPYANDTVCDNVTRWIGFAGNKEHKKLMIDTAEKSYSPARLKKYRLIYPVIGLIGRPSGYGRFIANANSILGFDFRDELGKIKCPTLIVGGDCDKVVGADAAGELHRLIPGSTLHVYSGLGHAAYEEAGDFNRVVFDFLQAPDRSAQVARITRYEKIMRKTAEILASGDRSQSALKEIEENAAVLDGYYGGDEWRRDFEDDEAGLLPGDLRRGVLSEDGLYDLLERCREYLEE
ncbi:MAG: alpha/beta fold hydrolase [Clostridia bacterium]|nr:alpha/beta fold hydrolase [Clostridia bacterium]